MEAPIQRTQDIEAIRVKGADAGKKKLLVKVPDEVMRRVLRQPEYESVPIAEREKKLSYLPEEVRARMLGTYIAIQRRHQLMGQLREMYVAKGYAAYECDEDEIIHFLGDDSVIDRYYVEEEEVVAKV